jgi:hypothetical protein
MMVTVFDPPPSIQHKKNTFNIISWTALLVGILDLAAAIGKFYIENGSSPLPVFKYIASGIFGKEGLTGGILMMTWGVVFHFMITFNFTFILFLIYPWVIKRLKKKFRTGIVYGLFIWIIMNQVVIPASSTPAIPFDFIQTIIAALILICTIGIPVALRADKHYLSHQNNK